MNLNKIIHSRILNITIDKLIKANAYNPLLGLVLITIALFVFFYSRNPFNNSRVAYSWLSEFV